MVVNSKTPGEDVVAEPGEDFVATLTIRRPPDNFFDTALVDELADRVESLAAGDTRAVVLRAEGRNFCAGADMGGGPPDPDALYGAAARLFSSELPIVAAIQGAAVGGGLGLALAADFRVGAASSRFSANFARLGIHHGFGLSATLPAAIGQQRALELLLTGRRLDGTEAFAIGLIDRLASEGELDEVAHELAVEIARSAPLAIRAIRATMRAELNRLAIAAMEREKRAQMPLFATADFEEGVAAMRERRPPRFRAV
jgi:2-(1,2-epoxy-1,2-dihydrophenyl)acetyl-CoA isomerase